MASVVERMKGIGTEVSGGCGHARRGSGGQGERRAGRGWGVGRGAEGGTCCDRPMHAYRERLPPLPLQVRSRDAYGNVVDADARTRMWVELRVSPGMHTQQALLPGGESTAASGRGLESCEAAWADDGLYELRYITSRAVSALPPPTPTPRVGGTSCTLRPPPPPPPTPHRQRSSHVTRA